MLWALLFLIMILDGGRILYFQYRAVAAQRIAMQGNLPEAIRQLETLLANPILMGRSLTLSTQYRLAVLYQQAEQYAASAQLCRAILRRRLKPGLESEVRRRLADALDGVGERSEAEEERHRAAACLQNVREDALTHLSRGKLLERENRHREACDAYLLAHKSVSKKSPMAGEALVRLALAAFNAGNPQNAVQWAEQALKVNLAPALKIEAHGTAGLGYSVQGQREQAEYHYAQALEIATATGNRDRAANYMVTLATTQMHSGRLLDAIQLCEKASALSLKARRLAKNTHSDCLRVWGRFAEAHTILEEARNAPSHFVPHLERRSQALLALGLSWIDTEMGDGNAAMRALCEAEEDLKTDPKLLLYWQATEVAVLALLGREAEARQRATAVEASAASMNQDRKTQLITHSMLARGYFAMKDFGRSKTFWQLYMDWKPDPVWQPNGWYYLGECERELGNAETARDAYARASSLSIDTYCANLARKRLASAAILPTPQRGVIAELFPS